MTDHGILFPPVLPAHVEGMDDTIEFALEFAAALEEERNGQGLALPYFDLTRNP